MTFFANRPIGVCDHCGKLCFTTRKVCRKYMKTRLPNDKFTIYKCGEYFHFGHAPYGVRRGIAQR